ncbi:MAG: tRNA lysidine(34) synthetase TilS [Bacilli bacterium]|nr:tRNA lysidine(34) synthetase TilS [Bacilli bacterium]
MVTLDKKINFNKGDRVVVGCSSGPDSMALVDLLLRIRERYDLLIIIAHVNHNIRKQSFEEQEFLKKYSIEHNIVFEDMIIENYGDDNFHNEARNIRYQFFESVVLKYHAKYLMTAHHGDDLVETILMRLQRGSNLEGYSGFLEKVPMKGYIILRPLITYTKLELEEYDKINHVPYYIDSSNNSDKYTRNRYRKYILPQLKKEDINVHLKYLKFSKDLMDANKFIHSFVLQAIQKVVSNNMILIDEFLKEDLFIQKEILYELLNRFYQDDLILLNDKHIDLILSVLHGRRANCSINLPNGVIGRKSYNQFCFIREIEDISSYEIEFDQYVDLVNHHSIEKIENTDDNSNNICRLNSKEIVLPLMIRSRKVGDKIYIKNMNGSKKVKDIFIDKKIPIHERDLWPIVLDSRGVVVWIPGLKKSKFDKKKNESYDIILKYS